MTAALTDFNDLAASAGLKVVSAQIDTALQAAAMNDEAANDSTLTEWPEPVMPGVRSTPDIPTDLLPSWAGEFAGAVSASTQTPPALSTMCCLSVLSTCVQRRYEVAPFGSGYTEPLAIWTASASPPGTRKSAVLNALMAPLIHWEKLHADRMRKDIARVNASRAVSRKRIEKLTQDAARADAPKERESLRAEIEREEITLPDEVRAPRLFTSDATAERLQVLLAEHGERMSIFSDESGTFAIMGGLYSGGQSSLDAWLQAHAGTSFRVDRASRAVHVDKPALTIGLLLQPGILQEAAGSKRFRDSGLLARFLWALPASNVGTRDVRHHSPIPSLVSDAYARGLTGLLQGWGDPTKAPLVLPLTEPAREMWLDFSQFIESRQGAGGELESVSDWTSKLPGAVARIACVLELAEVGLGADSVSQEAIDRAIRLAYLLIDHARAAFAMLGADAIDDDAAAVVRWIKVNNLSEFTRREAQKAQEGRFRGVDRLVKALNRLESNGCLRGEKRRNPKAPASMAYVVNPKLSTMSSLS